MQFDIKVPLVLLIELGQLRRDWTSVLVSGVLAIVVLLKLSYEFDNCHLRRRALVLHEGVLRHGRLRLGSEGNVLVLTLGFVREELLNLAILDLGPDFGHLLIVLTLKLQQRIQLPLFLVYGSPGLALEFLQHVAVVLLGLLLIVCELDLHVIGVVHILLKFFVRFFLHLLQSDIKLNRN